MKTQSSPFLVQMLSYYRGLSLFRVKILESFSSLVMRVLFIKTFMGILRVCVCECDRQHERDKKDIFRTQGHRSSLNIFFICLRNGYSDNAHLKLLWSPFALGLQSFSNIISGEMINFTNRLTEPLVHC